MSRSVKAAGTAGHLRSFLVAMKTTIINAVRKPTTSEYPDVERPRPERYRSSFALVHDEHGEEACIGCLACERICPSRVIKLIPGAKKESPATGKKRGYCDDFTLDLNACIYCELCVQVCPTDAILMVRERETPGFVREDLVLTMDKLYANETLKHVTWATGTKLIEMQAAPRPAPAAESAPGPSPAVASAPTEPPA